MREAAFMADIDDDRGNTLNKKIRSAQLAQYNYIFGTDSDVFSYRNGFSCPSLSVQLYAVEK